MPSQAVHRDTIDELTSEVSGGGKVYANILVLRNTFDMVCLKRLL